jgi:hypothetical protein
MSQKRMCVFKSYVDTASKSVSSRGHQVVTQRRWWWYEEEKGWKVARSAGAEGVWMFGVRVQFVRTGDSLVFTQCGKCHELGHVTAGCTMTRNSSKCYRCGGSHESGAHDEKCKATTHCIGGVCDCAFPCLLCKQTGHHCRSKECPKRGPFRPPPLASAKNPNPLSPPVASAEPTTIAAKPKPKKVTPSAPVNEVPTQREPLKNSPTPPPDQSRLRQPKGPHLATFRSK